MRLNTAGMRMDACPCACEGVFPCSPFFWSCNCTAGRNAFRFSRTRAKCTAPRIPRTGNHAFQQGIAHEVFAVMSTTSLLIICETCLPACRGTCTRRFSFWHNQKDRRADQRSRVKKRAKRARASFGPANTLQSAITALFQRSFKAACSL